MREFVLYIITITALILVVFVGPLVYLTTLSDSVRATTTARTSVDRAAKSRAAHKRIQRLRAEAAKSAEMHEPAGTDALAPPAAGPPLAAAAALAMHAGDEQHTAAARPAPRVKSRDRKQARSRARSNPRPPALAFRDQHAVLF